MSVEKILSISTKHIDRATSLILQAAMTETLLQLADTSYFPDQMMISGIVPEKYAIAAKNLKVFPNQYGWMIKVDPKLDQIEDINLTEALKDIH